ncbi:MAG: hypothetical protein A3C44_04530 [Gammaproteobacteria bacterium RIFCSPHIGHO2_02_FULL_39_13]|nr:MAG: hypothetical protein A3C44_04530 [Gammaproteobacteria bacterium RIFCSPHIGHO2_02_FULL_39_13]
MINFNKLILNMVKRKHPIINFIALLSCVSFLLSFVAICKPKSNTEIVIFDKQALFNDYYKSLEKINSAQQNPDDFKKVLEKKNEFFIKAMIIDLNYYQKSHHAIILKREALSAPQVILGSHRDITSSIEHELITQGAVS